MLDLTPFLDHWLYPFITILLTGLGAWLMVRTSAWLRAHAGWLTADQQQKIAQMEKDAIQAGTDWVLGWVRRNAEKVKPDVNSWVLRTAAQVAINHASGVLADNGADPEEVATKILAKLPDNVVDTDTTGAAAQTQQVSVTPLPPVT